MDVSGLELHSISSFANRRCTVLRLYCQLLLAYASAFRILNVFIRAFSSGSSDDGPTLEMLAEKLVRGNDESESWWFIHSHARTHRSTTD